jgi:succinoglycan biosynthesis transport protein ExoP
VAPKACTVRLDLAAASAAFFYFSVVGERYEAHTLLRVGQGIKDRAAGNSPLGEGIDLTSRMDSLARLGATHYFIRLASRNVGPARLFDEKQPTVLLQFQLSKHNLLYVLAEYVGSIRPVSSGMRTK